MTKKYFSSLCELLTSEQKENWEQDLSSEQFFALILAYNEKLSGKKRECNKITKEELTTLELAFKFGFSGNFNEGDVAKKLKELCLPEVCDIVDEQSSRKQKLAKLHNMAYEKMILKLKDFTDESKYKFQDIAEIREDSIQSDNYIDSCTHLDMLAEFWRNPDKILPKSQQSGQALELIKNRMETLSHSYLEEMYVGIYNRVSCVVDQEAISNILAVKSRELEAV